MTLYTLLTSPRLPAGILTADAWHLVTSHPVYAAQASDLTAAITAAGGTVTILDGQPAAVATQLADADDSIVWIAGAEQRDREIANRLANEVTRRSGIVIEAIYGSWDPPGARLLDVVAVLDQLRSPGGCPWDADQTHATLLPYLLEEAYEAYDAIDAGDRDNTVEELGDLLLQVVFHARLGTELPEPAKWTIDDVAATLVDKLVSRHPHVFGDTEANDAETVKSNWEQIKRAEKQRNSALDGVARSQPALSLAAKYLHKAEQFSVDVPEPKADVAVPDNAEQLGDLLLGIVAAARRDGLDPEAALRAAADRYAGQVKAAEHQAAEHQAAGNESTENDVT